jgi:metal-responsive CopG/Arc/MetJ family transcriptional regulator
MSVNIDDDLYRRLKRAAGNRGMSRYIAEAVRERLRGSESQLHEEYQAAAVDPERQRIAQDWGAIETEGW